LKIITLFQDPLLGLLAQDQEGNHLPVWQRPPDTTHQEMWEDGYQRLAAAYPDTILHRNGLDIPEDDLDIE
jgi:hypothetical protein